MPFQRAWDDTYPRVWDRWEADGTTWMIQDLPPEDEEEALDILFKDFCPDETLFALNKLNDDPESVQGMTQVWKLCFKQHVSLACYAESGGEKKLVALNVCIVKEQGNDLEVEGISGESLINLHRTMKYLETQFWKDKEFMGLDKILSGIGLVVRKEYRGAKLGAKILAAREPLCRFIGVKGTSTFFTGTASQTQAARSGFTSVEEVTVRQLSEAGLGYPIDNNTIMKLMVKRYD
ncbi:uncharacterized protein ACR2FA_009543 [Aphomia sociella]